MADGALAVDIGGTKITAGIVDPSGDVRQALRQNTPGSVDAIIRALVEVVDSVGGAGADLPIGVGAAGFVDRGGTVLYAPNLPWRDYPLRAELTARLGRRVAVENDANAAAWGEFRVGAARDASQGMVMLTVGTGVGGGLVLDGRLARGANGLAAEFGHVTVADGARQCPCGNRGCLEAMASGTAIGRTAQEWVAEGRVPKDSALTGLDELTGAAVGRAAQEGDETAISAVAECGRWLGVGIASVVNSVDPEVVVIGGGAVALGDLLLAPAVAAYEERLTGQPYRSAPPVLSSGLGEHGGLVGAGLLALERAREWE